LSVRGNFGESQTPLRSWLCGHRQKWRNFRGCRVSDARCHKCGGPMHGKGRKEREMLEQPPKQAEAGTQKGDSQQ